MVYTIYYSVMVSTTYICTINHTMITFTLWRTLRYGQHCGYLYKSVLFSTLRNYDHFYMLIDYTAISATYIMVSTISYGQHYIIWPNTTLFSQHHIPWLNNTLFGQRYIIWSTLYHRAKHFTF